jgi:hypothetical protein
MLVPEQFGIRKSISTEDMAFKLTDKMLKSVNQKLHVGRIFCDFAKAFDCVNCDILLTKLRCYNVQGIAAKWFRPYLMDGKQEVKIKSPNNTRNFFLKLGNDKT